MIRAGRRLDATAATRCRLRILIGLPADGTRFTDAYVTSQCTPTRATLLTGQYTARHGLWHVLSWYGYPRARMTEPMFAENFPRETFYHRQGASGRSAIEQESSASGISLPTRMGIIKGFVQQRRITTDLIFSPPLLSRQLFAAGGDRGVDQLTTEALDFIEASKDQPWFCFLSHHMIHGEVVAPQELEQKYRKQGYSDEGPYRAVYLAGLEQIDRSIGRLMKRLEELGEFRNTLILFLSDNGGIDQRLEHRALPKPHPETVTFEPNLIEYSNAPLRAGKGSIYEGGVRIPLIAHWPEKIPGGAVIETPVHAIDLLPTCFELANASAPEGHSVDGRSLVQLMTTGEADGLTRRSPHLSLLPVLRFELGPHAEFVYSQRGLQIHRVLWRSGGRGQHLRSWSPRRTLRSEERLGRDREPDRDLSGGRQRVEERSPQLAQSTRSQGLDPQPST